MVTSAAIPAVISPKWPLETPSIEVGRWTPGGIDRTTRRKTCGRDTTTGATAQNILAETAEPGCTGTHPTHTLPSFITRRRMTITFTKFIEPLRTLSMPAARNILELGQENNSSTFAPTVLRKLGFNCQMLNLTTTFTNQVVKLTGCPNSIFNRMGSTSYIINLAQITLVAGPRHQILTANARMFSRKQRPTSSTYV